MIRRLSRSIREYKRYAILAPLMMVGEVAMEVLIPTLMAGFMDSGVKTDDMSYVLRQGGLLLLCAMASFVACPMGMTRSLARQRACVSGL